ncbi:MAG: TraB/GumN family protein [Oscillospiraceae bacterium]|jgi:uncharacterized protein YbaP (TraB family)|nr:TraB/GumN family protein [Oscillospiraceae bacterium]
MKRFLSLLLLLAMLITLCSCSVFTKQSPSETEPEELTATPLLYSITTADGATLYLLGSIHATDDRAYPLPDYIMDAYAESDYLSVECDILAFETDYTAQAQMVKMFLCETGKTTADYLGQELYEDAKAFLSERGDYNQIYDMYTPAFWLSLIENALLEETDLDTDDGIDLYFLEDAHKNNKEIREVESAMFQFEMLTGFSDELNRWLIEDYIKNAAEGIEATNALYEHWLRGDEAEFAAFIQDDADTSELTPEQLALYEEYNTAMLVDRNIGMADKAEEYLAGGGTGFFVVGAAHIVGEGALVDLLTQRGYTVNRIN